MAEIFALVDDIFFQAKMAETAKQVGVELKSFSTGAALLAELEKQQPKLVVVDLNAPQSAIETITAVRAHRAEIRVIGFFSHVQTELAAQAREAGCAEVMPRSKFTKELAAIFSDAKI
ncbi:MAG TPA: response regulator [Candidatus Acidoferrales bacterium]|nr:response regulator [Candidatus Acidoferrales bacterium]